jgi:hypothetical protein
VAIDAGSNALPQKEHIIVTKLAAILRQTDEMDVSHATCVIKVTLKERKKLGTHRGGQGDLMLEKWALNKRRALFEEIFGAGLEISDKKL